MMLLSDHVFAQSPKTTRRLLRYVTAGREFGRFAAVESMRRRGLMKITDAVARQILCDMLIQKLDETADAGPQQILRKVISEAADWKARKKVWEKGGDSDIEGHTFGRALDLDIAHRFDIVEIGMQTAKQAATRVRWLIFLGRYDEVDNDRELRTLAWEMFCDGELNWVPRRVPRNRRRTSLEVLGATVHGGAMAQAVFGGGGDGIVLYGLLARWHGVGRVEFGEWLEEEAGRDGDVLNGFASFVLRHLKTDVRSWRNDLELWKIIVNRGLEAAPGSFIMAQVAAASTGVEVANGVCVWREDGFGWTGGVVERLHWAKGKANDAEWWVERCKETMRNGELVMCLAVLLSWARHDVLGHVLSIAEPLVDGLNGKEWSQLLTLSGVMEIADASKASELEPGWFQSVDIGSARVAVVLIGRVGDDGAKQRLARALLDDYKDTDGHSLWRIAEYELGGVGRNRGLDWGLIGRLSRLAKAGGVPTVLPVYWDDPMDVPREVAIGVLENYEEHCDQIVTICERAYGIAVAEDGPKVSTVAKRDGWFAVTGGDDSGGA